MSAAEPAPAPGSSTDEWILHVEGGPSLPLTATRVLLGRDPSGSDPTALELALPDASRTLSKLHALLEFEGGRWIVTDLDSTNGVVMIEADGAQRLLPPGGSSPVAEGFVLGRVALRLGAPGMP